MTNENFKDEYLDKDDYLFMDKIEDNNINIFRAILLTLMLIFIYVTYFVIDRVFFNKENPAPKLLLLLYILVLAFFRIIYYEFSVEITNIITNNSYPL